MKEKRFQQIIGEGGLEEFAFDVRLKVRVGDKFLGWAQNNVEAVIKEVLPKKGILVDEVRFSSETDDWYRASGDALCRCGKTYREHMDLYLLCNKDLVKL